MITDQQLQTCLDWACAHLKIQNAKGGASIKLSPNRVQKDFVAKSRALRMTGESDVAVKPRQVGLSTFLLCMVLAIAINIPGINILWVGSSEKNHKAIRRKFRVICNSAKKSKGSGFSEAVETNNVEELTFSNGSSIVFLWAGQTIDTAKDLGRGDTIHLAVFTEAAFWALAQESYEALRPALEHARPSIIWESTPNGMVGEGELFYRKAIETRNGKLDGICHFWPWWWDDRYRRRCNRENLIKDYTPEEKELVEKYCLAPEQIAWRRNQIIDLGGEGPFRVAYPEFFTEAFGSKNKVIFDRKVLRRAAIRVSSKQCLRVPTPPMFLEVSENIAYSAILRGETPEGYLRFYRHRVPGKRYFIGCDTAQGVEGGDWLVATVGGEGGEAVAQLRVRIDPIHFAWMVQLLAIYFNQTEHVYIEDKSTGFDVHRYLTVQIGIREIRENNAHEILQVYQAAAMIPNNPGTRPNLIAALVKAVNFEVYDIQDEETLHELSSLKVDKDGVIRAATGEHDDIPLSIAIMLKGREEVFPRYEESTAINHISDLNELYNGKQKENQDKYAFLDTTKARDRESEQRRIAEQRELGRDGRSRVSEFDDSDDYGQAGSIWDIVC